MRKRQNFDLLREHVETFLFIAKLIAAPLVSIFVTLLLSERIKNELAPIVAWLGTRKQVGVNGLWRATFLYGPERVEYNEVIEIKTLFGSVVGKIVPHNLNHLRLKDIAEDKPLRLRGDIKDNRYFTGIWFHPRERSHYHGAFELILHQDGIHMHGVWIGYSETKNIVEGGEWRFERIEE